MYRKWNYYRASKLLLVFIGIVEIHAASCKAVDIVLEWTPPETRIDGSPLTNISGYNIYYGSYPILYYNSIKAVPTNSVSIPNLVEGVTYYFIVTTLDEAGRESHYSEILSRNFEPGFTVNHPTPHSWLALYGITNEMEVAVGMDLDGDGFAVWQEYIMDSNPTDPNCYLAVHSMNLIHANGNPANPVVGYSMRWLCSPERVYDVEYSFDFNTWEKQPGLTNIVSTAGEIVVTNLFSGEQRRLFRLAVRKS